MYANYTGSDDVHKRIDESIETELNDWRILDSPRITIPDSYEFRIQTVGVFENKYILKKAMSIIIDSLKNIISIYSKANDLIKDSSTFMPNCYDVTLVDYDYTIGKILEYCLYEEYFLKESTLNFCAFKKFHPHLNTSVIRMAFKTETDITNASIYLINAAKIGIQFYKKILYQLGSEEYKSAFTDVKLLDVPVHTIAENEEQSDFIKPQPTPAASSATHAKMGSATPAASSATHAKMGSAPVPATKATKSRKTVTIVDE
jgi:DNA-directed RNA polymerase subunit L